MSTQTKLNKTNPCARVLGEIAKTCFLIGAETEFEAHFSWAAHVNEVRVEVRPKGSNDHIHNVMELDEYMNLPTPAAYGTWAVSVWRVDTYGKVKAFSDQLKAFYEQRLAAA